MRQILLTFISFLVMIGAAHAEHKQLRIGLASGYPPFYYFDEDKQPTGICIEIVNRVADSMGIIVQYASYPWKRMLNYGKEGKVDAVMPLFKTPAREQFLTFPETGLIDEDNRFFTSSSNPLEYSGNLADIVDLKIGVVDNYSYGEKFDNTIFPHKTIFQNIEQIISLVQTKRIELGVGNSKVVTYSAKLQNTETKIRFLSPPITVSPLFIGFSKENIDQDFVNRFNDQLKKLKNSKTYAKIVRTYDL